MLSCTRYGILAILKSGGADEIRTHDPLRARQVLSQLSYHPRILLSYLSYMRSIADCFILCKRYLRKKAPEGAFKLRVDVESVRLGLVS